MDKIGSTTGPVDPLQVLEFWKDFDLDGRRVGLDRQVRSDA